MAGLNVVVVGATGLIGGEVTQRLKAQGHQVFAASRRTGVDVVTGEGLHEACRDAQVIVDVTDSPSYEDAAVLEFFMTATRNLMAAATTVGIGHLVVLSIVGADGIPGSGYMRAKCAQESLITVSSVPYSVVRATQFFEFVDTIADQATQGSTVRLPPAVIQPIAAGDVAAEVARVALGAPLGGIVEVAGPQCFRFEDLVRTALAHRGDERTVVTDPEARYFGARLEERSLLAHDGAVIAPTRFSQWLATT